MSAAVRVRGELVLARGFGYARVEDSVAATEHTVYRIASITKPIAGTLAMKLAEAGVLRLDEPMSETPSFDEFCSEFKNTDLLFARNYRCDIQPLTLRHHLTHTVDGPAGERFSYNPVAFSWTSRTMAYRADRPFSELVRREIFEPVGMTSSARTHRGLPLPDDLRERLAPPYRVNEDGLIERAPPLPPQGDGAAGGIASTVMDLARFDAALDRNELLTATSKERMFTPPSAPSGERLPYGIGWYVQDVQGVRVIWHSGWWPEAYSGLYLKVPEKQLTFIVLANSEGVWWNNPLTEARVEDSAFAGAFMEAFF